MKIPFKKGDIMVKNNHWIFIFDGLKLSGPQLAVVYHAVCSFDGYTTVGRGPGIGYYDPFYPENFRLATNDEKKLLFNRIKIKGTYWDKTTFNMRYSDNNEIIPDRVPNLDEQMIEIE